MSNVAWEALSDQAMTATGVVYFLALVAHSAQWAMLRKLPADVTPTSDRSAVLARFGLLLTVAGAAVHLVGLVARGLAADPDRVPWGNMYEFTITGTFVVVALYLGLYRRYSLSWMAPWTLGFVFVVLMLAMVVLHERVAPLTEALSSPWLVIHVISAILATGIFSLGGIVSVLYLFKARAEARAEEQPQPMLVGGYEGVEGGPVGDSAPTGILARLPAAADLDRLAYRLHAFGFPIWTFAVLITGPIWAHQAWARYWGWDAKEVWAFITWVVYAAYLHARATAGWRGRNAAIIALVGLATLWFNFIGINYFFGGSSQHSYAAPAAVVVPVDS
jgi:cytochrome c-type biogenesis protein CcsB